jgi:hypothetical protein
VECERGALHITGGVHSNGSLNVGTGGSSWGPTTSLSLTSGRIYCDTGTGTASQPTTWNGAIILAMGNVNIESSVSPQP